MLNKKVKIFDQIVRFFAFSVRKTILKKIYFIKKYSKTYISPRKSHFTLKVAYFLNHFGAPDIVDEIEGKNYIKSSVIYWNGMSNKVREA